MTPRKQTASLLCYLLSVWVVMLTIGVVHAHVLRSVLAVDYSTTALLVALAYGALVLLGAAYDI